MQQNQPLRRHSLPEASQFPVIKQRIRSRFTPSICGNHSMKKTCFQGNHQRQHGCHQKHHHCGGRYLFSIYSQYQFHPYFYLFHCFFRNF
jgi:hypothetical protein